MNLLIYEPDNDTRGAFRAVVAHLSGKVTILCTGDLAAAKDIVDRMHPSIVITEAIPELDVLNPEKLPENDSGTALITYIRQHQDPAINTAWIIVAASRLMEFVPSSFKQLVGEHAFLCKKPEVVAELRELLPTLVDLYSKEVS